MTLKNFLKNNLIIFIYIILSVILEIYGIYFTNCEPYLSQPWYFILFLFLISSILILSNNKILQFIISLIFLIGQISLITGFIFLFDSNGQYFQWSMLNQRTDAFGTIELISLQYKFLIPALILLIVFVIGVVKYIKINKKNKNIKNHNTIISKKIQIGILSVIVTTFILIPIFNGTNTNIDYEQVIYEKQPNSYQKQGITSSVVYELLKGTAINNITSSNYTTDGIEEFIYQDKLEKTDYYGISEGNNLVMILLESFEWYPFTKYPKLTEKLYPNFYKLMSNSILSTNFYAREKTDVSEALSLIGNYPTGDDVHYGFPENSYPYSLPNILKSSDENIVNNSFHPNKITFYNREETHESFGFDNKYGIDYMEERGVHNYWNSITGERNLDSEAINSMKDLMFPLNQRFFTYYISFTTHGFYGERETLEEYYDILDSYNAFPDTGETMDEYLRTYAAAVMDMDRGIGYMMDYLEENNLLENTTILLFSDHNTYYNNLSYYAKDIEEKTFDSELYHIPMMIYDQKLVNAYKENNNNSSYVTKFTTTSDILPTILDIFGLEGYSNLYYGSSIFTDKESIIYSRSYGVFVTDKFVGYSLNDVLYKSKDYDEEYEQYFVNRAETHLKKLNYINKIYYTDYFKDNPLRR